MSIENEIETLSIRGRFALTLRCVESAAEAWGFVGSDLDEIFATYWTYTEAENVWTWSEEVEDSLNDRVFEAISDRHTTPLERRLAMLGLFDRVWDVGTCNFYGGYSSCHTAEPALRAVAVLLAHEIPLPDVEPIRELAMEGPDEYGQPFCWQRNLQ